MKPDLIVMDDVDKNTNPCGEITLRINQSPRNEARMENAAAPIEKRWADAKKRGYALRKHKKGRWRLEYTTVREILQREGRRSALIRELPITMTLKEWKLSSTMTVSVIKREAMERALAHEVVYRIKSDPKSPSTFHWDTARAKAKDRLAVWFTELVDRATFEHLYLGTPVDLRSAEDRKDEGHRPHVSVHNIHHRRKDASVDGATVSGEAPKRRTPLLSNLLYGSSRPKRFDG